MSPKKKTLLLILPPILLILSYGQYVLYEIYEKHKPENQNLTREIYRKTQEAVVTLECMKKDGLSIGSGFIINEEGLIMTAWHVVNESEKIWVYPNSATKESPWEAKILGHDELLDTALIAPKYPQSTTYLKLGDSDILELGDPVWSIGTPLGIPNTITHGRISNRKIVIPSMPWCEVILTDAIINEGNSGGPLLNLGGEVIGLNIAITGSVGDKSEPNILNIYVSVPINSIKKILSKLKAGGNVKHVDMGMAFSNSWKLSDSDYELFKIKRPQNPGVIILKTQPDSLAQKCDLLPGDAIIFVNGKPIEKNTDLLEMLCFEIEPEEEFQITIARDNQHMIKFIK